MFVGGSSNWTDFVIIGLFDDEDYEVELRSMNFRAPRPHETTDLDEIIVNGGHLIGFIDFDGSPVTLRFRFENLVGILEANIAIDGSWPLQHHIGESYTYVEIEINGWDLDVNGVININIHVAYD